MAKHTIITILKPTELEHDVYIMNAEGKLSHPPVKVKMDDLHKTLFSLAEKENCEVVKLYGPDKYVSGVKKTLEKDLKTKYLNLKLKIEIGS